MNVYYKVTLTMEEKEELEKISKKGNHSQKKIVNALILLSSDEGPCSVDKKSTNREIAKILNLSERKVERMKKRFIDEGLEVALNGKASERVYEKKIDGDAEAHLIALSCSEPPEGYSRWSLRLLSDEMVKLEYIESVSHETVRKVLKKTN
jgi:hypothetical protein